MTACFRNSKGLGYGVGGANGFEKVFFSWLASGSVEDVLRVVVIEDAGVPWGRDVGGGG